MDMETSRRGVLKCLGVGAGTLFTLNSGIFTANALGQTSTANAGIPLFLQISDTHIGFNKDANPDVIGTLNKTIDLVNAMPHQPAFLIHTGDVTHLSKAEQFDTANQLLSRLQVGELHVVPGEHDVTDGPGTEFFARFGKASDNRGYYSFDRAGVHFIALVNVMHFESGGLGALGADQMDWLKKDLAGRSASQPIVVFAHMPLWTIYAPWGWGTTESAELASLLKRFGSVTVLNGHIHQIVQKVEGNITFHTARSTAYPQPLAGVGPGPGPLKVATDMLPKMLGVTSVSVERSSAFQLSDTTLA
ncbi:MAG TPA: metallophosphoesterase [Rhizomicrobium sp.]